MPPMMQLLPKSAAAFAPRAAPTIVLNTKVEPWLTQTLKRINKVKRPLHSVPQHFRCLTETLGGDAAIWDLCSLLLPKAPEKELLKDDDPLKEAVANYNMVHIQAYVVHVDMVSQQEVAFKLTTESIDTLVKYHRDVYSADTAASIYDWPEKDAQLKKLQEEFVQAANRFVFRTHVKALEGLEEDGVGELLEQRSAVVKAALMNLFTPLTPPPPRIVDVVIPAAAYAQQAVVGWWPSQQTYIPSHSMPNDSWQVLPSTPSPTITHCSDPQSQLWTTVGVDAASIEAFQLPSPTPSGSQYDYSCDSSMYNTPESMPVMPAFPFPSQLPHGCGSSMNMGGNDYTGMAWGFNSFATPQYAATM